LPCVSSYRCPDASPLSIPRGGTKPKRGPALRSVRLPLGPACSCWVGYGSATRPSLPTDPPGAPLAQHRRSQRAASIPSTIFSKKKEKKKLRSPAWTVRWHVGVQAPVKQALGNFPERRAAAASPIACSGGGRVTFGSMDRTSAVDLVRKTTPKSQTMLAMKKVGTPRGIF
jgi:hypothetical protein